MEVAMNDSADPVLELAYGFDPDPGANIIVSTDPRYAVTNTLNFIIRNPADHPVVNFENPDGLTPEDQLPPIDAPNWPQPLDRLYLRFPWCDQEPFQCAGYLTTTSLSTGITTGPGGQDGERWYTQAMSSSKYGRYWILFPKTAEVHLEANQSIRVVISNIVSYIPQGTMTNIYINPDVKGYLRQEQVGPGVFLTNPPPIIKFWAEPTTVKAGGDAKLFWATTNAQSAQLSPINGGVQNVPTNEPNGYAINPLYSTNFTLEAQSPIGLQNRQSATINVTPVSVASFTATPSQGVRLGQAVTLSWQTDSAVSVNISPGVGSVCSQACGCNEGSQPVIPAQYTNYQLTAQGQGQPQTANAVVFPLQVGWTAQTSQAPWNTRDRPVFLAYRPNTSQIMEMWILAGGTGTTTSWVYRSQDGTTWAPATSNAGYPVRKNAGGLAFNQKLWLMGGEDRQGRKLNDIWSSPDGSTWTQIEPEGGTVWSARSDFGCIEFMNKIWVMGGLDGSGKALNDIWNSEDGVTWTRASSSPLWSPRAQFGITRFENQLWLLAGRLNDSTGSLTNQVWYSGDGLEWVRKPHSTWHSRIYPNTQTINNVLYLIGGVDAGGQGMDDFYTMGTNFVWTVRPGPPWSGLAATGCLNYQEAIWFAGGITESEVPNKSVWVYAPNLG